MPRPRIREITFSIDGREVRAPENAMLVDAAKLGDVEIPVFCYEPKLGQPVGACRMCLVEVEGIPKLQTACSTPVKDGMVVHTQTDRVREAQQAVVEFLLINHPLDCPVCDKGGECPLQDISFGWGGGRSRFIEPKRHFKKPLALSPLIAIDRERCILCYRCVRFSQEIAEDYQLVFVERGAHTYVGTYDERPYVAPFSGNVIELCPVGALTSQPYRFRARPWDIEGAGSVCTLCPAQCNVHFTVRDERTLRVVSWDRALDEAAAALKRAGAKAAALADDATTNEEGFLLQRLMREALGSPHIDSGQRGALPLGLRRALTNPALQATVPDLEFAHTVLVLDCEPLDEMPILDLRIRKGVRRQGARLAVATSRPSALDGIATTKLRFAPGSGAAFVSALAAALSGSREVESMAAAAGVAADDVRALANLLARGGEDVVILYGDRLLGGAVGLAAANALLGVAERLRLGGHDGAGLLEIPAAANSRGLREVGVLPNAAPGLADPPAEGEDARGIAAALADGDLTALYLLHADPLRTHPDRTAWERALARATTVIAHASFLTDGVREYANVVFPAASYAEKEGTVVHPDGRVQRLRPGIGRPGDVRMEWQVLADLAARLGTDLGVLTGAMATKQVFDAVPFYAGLTLDGLGGRGERWPAREQASALPAGEEGPFGPDPASEPPEPEPMPAPIPAPSPNGKLVLGTYRSIWAAPEVEVSPALKFLAADQRAELSPQDAQRLGLRNGQRIAVAHNGSRVEATVALRGAVPEGFVFLEEAIAQDSANALTSGDMPVLVEVTPS